MEFRKCSGDILNNGLTMMFVAKKRYSCFHKQSNIDTSIEDSVNLNDLGSSLVNLVLLGFMFISK